MLEKNRDIVTFITTQKLLMGLGGGVSIVRRLKKFSGRFYNEKRYGKKKYNYSFLISVFMHKEGDEIVYIGESELQKD